MPKKPVGGSVAQTLPSLSQQAYGPNVNEPLPDKHPFYELVGRVASEWAHLEHTLDETIWVLAKMPMPLAPCLTSQLMGVGPRCKAIILLGGQNLISEATQKNYRTLMSDSYHLADLRARVVHDPWFMKMGEQKPTQFRAMPYSDPRFGAHEITEAEITDTLKKIGKLKERALQLHTTVEIELAASQGKPA